MAKGGAGKGARRRHLQPRSSRPSGGVAKAEAGKQARRNMAKQARQAKQTQVVAARRAAADADAAVPPRVLVIVAAGEDAQAEAIGEQLLSHAAVADGATAATAARQRFTVLRPSRRVDSVLDAMKAGDVMVLAIPADGALDCLATHTTLASPSRAVAWRGATGDTAAWRAERMSHALQRRDGFATRPHAQPYSST